MKKILRLPVDFTCAFSFIRAFSFICALSFICAFSLVRPVYAADGKVTYDGSAGQFVFAPGSEHSLTDLFPDFKDVMPGDTLTQKITVKNDASNKVKVQIYLRSLGADEDSEAFLSRLGLKVQKSGDNEMAYMFDAAADETAQLTDWVCLGTLYSGGEVNLDVTLSVPTELSDEFQNNVGYLDWEFMVTEFPVEDTDPKPPKTGDDTNVWVWIILVICAFVGVTVLFIWRKKSRGQEENTVKAQQEESAMKAEQEENIVKAEQGESHVKAERKESTVKVTQEEALKAEQGAE